MMQLDFILSTISSFIGLQQLFFGLVCASIMTFYNEYALTQFFIFYLFASSLDLNNNKKKNCEI